MKAVKFLDVTLNLTTGKYLPCNKPDNIPLYIKILANHSPNIIKNLPGNIFNRINNWSADETACNKSKDLYKNALVKSGFEHKITFQKQQNTSTVANETKNRKREIIWFNRPFSLIFSTNIGKKFSQTLISVINCSTVIMSRLVIVPYLTYKVWSTVITKIYYMSKKNLFHAIVGTKHHVQHKNLAVANIKILYILVKFEPQI